MEIRIRSSTPNFSFLRAPVVAPPFIGTFAEAQKFVFFLDSGFRRNDTKVRFPTFYAHINLDF